jgi:type II secretory pathway pseudopilin PulG
VRRRRGFLLIEVVVSLLVCSLLLIAAGRLMRQSRLAGDHTEAKWASLLACRTVLELSCASGNPADTSLVYEETTIRAWTTVDSLESGELIIRAHAVHPTRDCRGLDLARLVWPRRGDSSLRKGKA